MKTVTVQVESDHILTLCRAKKPILAIAELIWNSFDADSKQVQVKISDNHLGDIASISVIDDGHGINYDDALSEFSKLGGSWKKIKCQSRVCKRILHGRLGKGRFRSFALGERVEWKTRYSENGNTREYSIVGRYNDPKTFQITDPAPALGPTGTEVTIDNISKNFRSILGDPAYNEISGYFALYLKQYPDTSITYCGQRVSTSHLEKDNKTYPIDLFINDEGRTINAELTIIEWSHQAERYLYLCDHLGFTLLELPVAIHAKGYNFSAYIKSEYLRELYDDGQLDLQELHPPLKKLIDAARDRIKNHFRKKSSEEASALVKKWKEDDIYPYAEEPANPVEEAERQVFEVCALNVHSYLPEFENESLKSKKLAFSLLKNALETNPSAIQTILTEVLDLPQDKQIEFAKLLRKTSLDAIITASKTVTDRLVFLRGLEMLVFDIDSREQLLERKQLHRIVSDQAWIFGKEYHLSADDQSLTEILKKYRKELGEEVCIVDEVLREDGSRAIVDLVLGRRIPTPRGEEREHIVIELKRPNFKLNDEALTQIRSYAFAVANDERFKEIKARWNFWLISNDMSDSVRRQSNMSHLPSGCAYIDADQDLRVWVKNWAQVLSDCDGRLKFFQDQLQYRAKREDALEYLRREYKKFLPPAFQEQKECDKEA